MSTNQSTSPTPIPSLTESIDLTTLTVEKVQEGFLNGKFTAESLTCACLQQIATYNAHYNAIIFLNDEALADARSIDRRRESGEVLGPLAGVPVVIKDPMDMVGFPTTAGWSLLYSKMGGVDLMPARDSPVVARMRAAGAIILGKTNVPVLSHTGTHADDSWAGPHLMSPRRVGCLEGAVQAQRLRSVPAWRCSGSRRKPEALSRIQPPHRILSA